MTDSVSQPSVAAAPHTTLRVLTVLGFGVLAASMSSILIRFAQLDGLPSLLIAAGRLTLAALALTPFALRRHRADLAHLSGTDLLMAGAAGLMLAIHFATWITSLEYTSVLISVVFVTTGPLWVALLEFAFLRVRIRQIVTVGLAAAVAGGILIGVTGSPDTSSGSNPLLGGALALIGAIAFALYLVIGRTVRAKLPLLPYIWLVYSITALFLILMLLLNSTPVTGFPVSGYLAIVLLAVFPQMIGHTSFNYALRYVSATFVSVASQLEPIGSALVAFIVFQELPSEWQLIGSAAIVLGVVLASLGQRKE
jgi:drug/metabolite transporter (DMT)-like permease